MDADDHALVERLTGAHKHATTIVKLPERIGHRLAVVAADEHAVTPIFDRACHRTIGVEDMAHDAGAAGQVEKLAMKADQAAGRHTIVEPHSPFAV